MTENKGIEGNSWEWKQLWEEAVRDDTLKIMIPRSEAFVSTAKAVSEYIKGLDIPSAQNDKLIDLMVAHTLEAEKGGFLYGLKLGLALLEYERQERKKEELP